MLHGGSRPRLVEIRERSNRGGGREGTIFYVDIASTSKKGKEKVLKLVEKRFHEELSAEGNFGNPLKQFGTVQDLAALNRRKKLGLRFPPTVRLLVRGAETPSLVISRLKVVPFRGMTKEQRFEYLSDLNRQLKVAEKNGYHIGLDSFRPTMDKKSGMVVAVISDFGNLRKSFGH